MRGCYFTWHNTTVSANKSQSLISLDWSTNENKTLDIPESSLKAVRAKGIFFALLLIWKSFSSWGRWNTKHVLSAELHFVLTNSRFWVFIFPELSFHHEILCEGAKLLSGISDRFSTSSYSDEYFRNINSIGFQTQSLQKPRYKTSRLYAILAYN